MKNSFNYLQSLGVLLLTLLMSISLAACSDDDNPGSGSAQITVGDKTVKFKNCGYFIGGGEDCSLLFSTCNPESSKYPSKISYFQLWFYNIDEVPLGSYKAREIELCIDVNISHDSYNEEYYATSAIAKISKEGNIYTINIPNLEFTEESTGKQISTSFSYEGPLKRYKDLSGEEDY